MLLADWLKEAKVQRTDFAERIGVQPSYITALCAGTNWPSRKVMTKIIEETGGKVGADDFLGQEQAEPTAAAPERRAS